VWLNQGFALTERKKEKGSERRMRIKGRVDAEEGSLTTCLLLQHGGSEEARAMYIHIHMNTCMNFNVHSRESGCGMRQLGDVLTTVAWKRGKMKQEARAIYMACIYIYPYIYFSIFKSISSFMFICLHTYIYIYLFLSI